MKRLLRVPLTLALAFGTYTAPALPLILPVSVVSLSIAQTSCKESDLKKTAEAAKDLGGEVRDLIDAVGQAYSKGLITLAQKDRFADLLGSVARGGIHGVDVIEALQAQGVKVPNATQRQQLNRIFDDEVITPFLSFLTEIGKLSDDSAIAIRTAMSSVRAAILLFSSRVGRDDIKRKIEAVQLREVWSV
jgi:hypothetical protein